MYKSIIFLIILITTIVFTGGSNKEVIPNTISKGTLVYSECIYLNPLSSSTRDYFTEINQHNLSYEIEENKFTIHDRENDSRTEYIDIEYVYVDVYLNIDVVLGEELDNFLESVDARYDIYSRGVKIDYIIYIRDEHLFLAESKMIGGDNSVFTIWTIISGLLIVNTFT